MELKIKVDDVEIELQRYDDKKLDKLIKELSESHDHAKNHVCPDLDRILIKQEKVAFETIIKTIIELSRWCNTNDPEGKGYGKGKPKAIEISKHLFNKLLPRLAKEQFIHKQNP